MRNKNLKLHPYPGLRPFKYSDSRFFYGRKNIIQDIASELVENKSIYIVGPSGTGKSSLAYAGLIPALQSGIIESNARRWRTVVFRPSGGPTANLAGALYDCYHLESDEDKSGINSGNPMISTENMTITRENFVNLALSENSRPFFKEVRKLARADTLTNENGKVEENLLIIADQFEELFRLSDLDRDSDHSESNMTRLKNHRSELDHFVKIFLGLRAYGGKRIHTLATMRTEYLVDCEINASLLKDVDRHLFLVRKLNDQELSEIITQPARQLLGSTTKEGHPTVHQDLVDRLIEELHEEAESYLSSGRYRLPDQLPLLQHSLSQIWQNRHLDGDEDDLSLQDYISICSQDTFTKQEGAIDTGLSLALSTHLNDIYNSVEPRLRNAVKRILLSLIEFGPQDKWAVRRRVKLSRLLKETGLSEEDFHTIAKAFRTKSGHFIYVPRQKYKAGENFDPIVDISHESLLRHWNKLRDWIDEESRDIATASDYFRRNLLTGHEVEQAIEWQNRKITEGTLSEAWISRHLTNIARSDSSETPEIVRKNIIDTINKSLKLQDLQRNRLEKQKKREVEAEKKKIEDEKNKVIARQKARTKAAIVTACMALIFFSLAAFGLRSYQLQTLADRQMNEKHGLYLTLAELLGTGENDTSLLVLMEAYNELVYGQKGRDKIQGHIKTNYVNTDYFQERKEYANKKGLFVADVSENTPKPEKILISKEKDNILLITLTENPTPDKETKFLNIWKIKIPEMQTVFYKRESVAKNSVFIDAAQTADEKSVIILRVPIADEGEELFKYQKYLIDINGRFETKNLESLPSTRLYLKLSDDGLHLRVDDRILEIEDSTFMEPFEGLNIKFDGFSRPNIREVSEGTYQVEFFEQPKRQIYSGTEFIDVVRVGERYLIYQIKDYEKNLSSFEIRDSEGELIWGPNEIDENISSIAMSENLEFFGVLDSNGVLMLNGDNNEWREYRFPASIIQNVKSPEKGKIVTNSYNKNNNSDRNIIKMIQFTGSGEDFVGMLDDRRLFSSREKTILNHHDVSDIVLVSHENNPQMLIVTDTGIWLYGNKDKMSISSEFSDALELYRENERLGRTSDPFKLAEKYLGRCLSSTERTRLRLNKDVPCFCAKKYPYNNILVGDNWTADDKKRCKKN